MPVWVEAIVDLRSHTAERESPWISGDRGSWRAGGCKAGLGPRNTALCLN